MLTTGLGANWAPIHLFDHQPGYAKSLLPFIGEVPERSNGAVSKTVVPLTGDRGFESLPLRQQIGLRAKHGGVGRTGPTASGWRPISATRCCINIWRSRGFAG